MSGEWKSQSIRLMRFSNRVQWAAKLQPFRAAGSFMKVRDHVPPGSPMSLFASEPVLSVEGTAKGKTAHGSSPAKEKHKRRKLNSQLWVPALTGEMRVESSVDTQGCPLSLDVQILTVFIASVGLNGYNQLTRLISLSRSEFPPTHPVWPLLYLSDKLSRHQCVVRFQLRIFSFTMV